MRVLLMSAHLLLLALFDSEVARSRKMTSSTLDIAAEGGWVKKEWSRCWRVIPCHFQGTGGLDAVVARDVPVM